MHAAVAGGAPGTVSVALEVLAAGGNAVDAAVAAAFAMPVTEPGLASLGGGGFLMVRDADGSSHLIDFFAAVPTPHAGRVHNVITVEFSGAQQNFTIGPSTVAVPGALPGLLHAHRRHGRMPRDRMLQAPLACVRRGAELTAQQALVLQLIGAVVTSTPASKAVYAPHGHLLTTGEIMRNPQYATFLAEVAEGLSWLPAEGPLHPEDLSAYTVYEREPLRVELPGGTLLTNPGPSLGGSIIAHALGELAPADEPTALQLLLALRDATEHNKSLAPVSVRGTTHISVTDGDQTVALTVSNGSCSGVMLGDTGIQLNNMMGESDLHPDGFAAPVGSRIRSMMAPSLVERDGVITALGTGGSERIRSAMTRVIAALLRGADLQAAIDAPRVHLDNDGVVQVEPGFPPDQVAALPEPVSQWRAEDFYFGGVHAVSSDGVAAADARRGGHTGRV
jgi:gamma-glutamyltranspeptidase / glutathione hydrolase